MQADSTAVAQSSLLEGESVERTLSIWDLITSGGLGGQIIIATLFALLFAALYLYFERIMAINAATKIDATFMNNIKMNISNGKIDAAKM
jgi:biopolymer transport protein ExbB